MNDSTLDLADIQGNILRAYAFPYGRFIFLNLTDSASARVFIAALIPRITNAEVWPDEKPRSTMNIALSRTALSALELPEPSINSFPDEFLQGMAARANGLGDVGSSAPANWEAIWQGRVDVLISIHGQAKSDCDAAYQWIVDIAESSSGATILGYQESNQLSIDGEFTPKEHFGYTDGIAQPEFRHSHAKHTLGDGKISAHGKWESLETGDFIIGYSNEAKELEAYPEPMVFSKNGSFLVYREYIESWGKRYPGGVEKLKAKFMGRWPDGTPISLSPDKPDQELANDANRSNDFSYGDDPDGARCPLGSHIRRANPRDALGFHGKLSSRRRIIRRGMPYGSYAPETEPVDEEERGLVFIALNANFSRQFEFIQQQWINYGNDLQLGEDTDPVIGIRKGNSRFVIPGDSSKGEEPFFCSGLPSFVTLRGGDYFFVPSLTALQQMAQDLVDPR
jgi:Dyp-type peroxidase family